MFFVFQMKSKVMGFQRFTTKGALGDNGSLDVDEVDEEEPFLKSLQKPCFSLKHTSFISNWMFPSHPHLTLVNMEYKDIVTSN